MSVATPARQRHGFTLIELVVVVAIFGTLFAGVFAVLAYSSNRYDDQIAATVHSRYGATVLDPHALTSRKPTPALLVVDGKTTSCLLRVQSTTDVIAVCGGSELPRID